MTVEHVVAGPRARADGITDTDGKYAVPKPDTDHYVIVVASPQGYAEASWKQLARGEQVRLHPWGRIEGGAYHQGKPQPKANVRLWRVGENDEPVSHQTQVTADANGRFVFPRVAPGGHCARPAATAASSMRSTSGCIERLSGTACGPPTPW